MKDGVEVILLVVGICLIYMMVFIYTYWGRIRHERTPVSERDLESGTTNPMTIQQ